MSISFRLLLGYFLIVGLAAWFVLNTFSEEVKPGVRQTMEETLVDSAYLLAEIAAVDVQNGQKNYGHLTQAFAQYQATHPKASIWGFKKNQLDLQLYITDQQGMVVYDSKHQDVGKDFSQWNNIYRTLRGQYGARSSRTNPKDERSSVMHVSAPIKVNGQLVGVLTLAKPTLSVQPFIDKSQQRITRGGWWLMGGALFIGLLFTWWLNRAIFQLRMYAKHVNLDNKTPLPKLGSSELQELGNALSEMRERLDGREYIEAYVHHLIHEMKSPLTAITGAAELLEGKPNGQAKQQFIQSIKTQSVRLKSMLDKLLALAKLEHRRQLAHRELIDVDTLIRSVINDCQLKLTSRHIEVVCAIEPTLKLKGERFLLHQALFNLLDNAIDFSPEHSQIHIHTTLRQAMLNISIQDVGSGIPDYALPRIFERFYSLQRPNGEKSTGLGLAFVKEVANLHQGQVRLANTNPHGVIVTFSLPVG